VTVYRCIAHLYHCQHPQASQFITFSVDLVRMLIRTAYSHVGYASLKCGCQAFSVTEEKAKFLPSLMGPFGSTDLRSLAVSQAVGTS